MTTHIDPLLSDYVLDLLDSADRMRVEEHVAACTACRDRLNEERTFVRLVQSGLDQSAANDAAAGVRRSWRATASERELRRRWRKTLNASQRALALVAVLLLSVGSLVTLQESRYAYPVAVTTIGTAIVEGTGAALTVEAAPVPAATPAPIAGIPDPQPYQPTVAARSVQSIQLTPAATTARPELYE